MLTADPTLLGSCLKGEEEERGGDRGEAVKPRTGGETPHRRRQKKRSKHEDIV